MKKIITFGVFDYFHLGHLRLFEQCKTYGDYLIVAVQDDDSILKYKPDAKVLYSLEERIHMIKSLKCVDEVVTYKSIYPDIENYDFDILALGEDHTSERFMNAAKWSEEHGREVVRLKRTQGICSSNIKNNI